jgi:hypothetical protein
LKSHTDNFLDECRASLQREQAQSLAATQGWSHVDKTKVHADWDVLYKQLAPLVDVLSPEHAEVQRLIGEHFAVASRFYVPTRQTYIGLALFYRENADMRQFHNSYHPAMVDFLELAIREYALKNL